MNALESLDAQCPYCGEPIALLVECADGPQRYVEDCAVCCRPIDIGVDTGADGMPRLTVRRQDD